MKFAIVVFPGSNCDHDVLYLLKDVLGQDAGYVWHADQSLKDSQVVIIPGGFAHGDYLRCGAIAKFSPIMDAVRRHAQAGRPVFGICNGFQILQEAGLLPGALLRNAGLKFVCDTVHIRVERNDTLFTRLCSPGQVLRMPISHHDGNFFADQAVLDELERNGQVLFRYCDAQGRTTPEANPNGSLRHIAGITNRAGNVMALMPHPDRAGESLLGSQDGLWIFRSLIESLRDNGLADHRKSA